MKFILALSLFIILYSGSALAVSDVVCPRSAKPNIKIIKNVGSVNIDNTKTAEQLKAYKIDTISPYGGSLEIEVGGLTRANDTAIPKFNLMVQGTNISENVCIYITDIEMEIKLEQEVLIPSKYTKNSCMYKQVMIHEMKHVKTNERIMEKYAPLFEARLKAVSEKLGVYYVKKSSVDKMTRKISVYVKNSIENLFNQMETEKVYEQQKIDTLQEYERVRKACEGW